MGTTPAIAKGQGREPGLERGWKQNGSKPKQRRASPSSVGEAPAGAGTLPPGFGPDRWGLGLRDAQATTRVHQLGGPTTGSLPKKKGLYMANGVGSRSGRGTPKPPPEQTRKYFYPGGAASLSHRGFGG